MAFLFSFGHSIQYSWTYRQSCELEDGVESLAIISTVSLIQLPTKRTRVKIMVTMSGCFFFKNQTYNTEISAVLYALTVV